MSVGPSVWRGDKGWSLARNTLRDNCWEQISLRLWPQSVDPIRFNSIECRWQRLPCTYWVCRRMWLLLMLPSITLQCRRGDQLQRAYQGPLSALIIVMVKSCVIQDIHDRSSSSYRSLWATCGPYADTMASSANQGQIMRRASAEAEWCNVWRRRRSLIAEQLNVLCTYTTFVNEQSPIDRSIGVCLCRRCCALFLCFDGSRDIPSRVCDAGYSLFGH